MRYSVVVPVYNEGANIAAFCARFVDELPEGGELLIVYDFEEDDTLTALAQIPADRRPPNVVTLRNTLGRGVRNAIVAGMRAATAPVVVVMMADLSDDFARVEEMIVRAEAGADVVCASRYMRGGRQIGGPWLKGLLSRAAGVSLHALGALPVHDPTNSFKAYRRTFLEATPVETLEGFALAMELTVKAQLAGKRVEEVPATWRDRSAGESRFRLGEWLGSYLRWYWKALAQRSVLWTALLPLAILFAVGTIVPIPLHTNLTTEHWLVVALHEAFLRGWRFGSDVIFTFGPWGFVLNGYHPGTVDLMFFLRLTIVMIGLLMLWKTIESRSGRRSLAVAAVAVLAIVVNACWSDTFFLFLPLLILFAGFERSDRSSSSPLYFALIVAATLLGLAKFSMLVMVSLAVAAVAADELRRRSFPWTAAIHALALAAFWLLARQQPGDFLPFLRGSLEMASGYGEAMGRDDTLYSPRAFRPFLISALTFTLIVAAVEIRRSLPRAVLLLGGWSALLLLLFKSGFVRADHFHMAPAAGAMLLMQITYLTMRLRERLIVLLLAVPILVSIHVVGLFGERSMVRDISAAVRTSSRNVAGLIRWPAFRERMHQVHLAAIAESAPPPRPIRGDIYPAPFAIIARPGFGYEPRPVYVSYAVYTPRLAQTNARWLAKARPPHVLFDIDPIDRQLPSLQDGLSWPILLADYELKGEVGRHLILERRASPSSAALTRTATLRAKLGEKVQLPSHDPTFARFTIALSRRGKVASVFYRTPPLRIRLGLADGTEKKFRFVRRMAESEFLLSPLVENRPAFAALHAGKNLDAVRWIVVEPERAEGISAYETAYGIELYTGRPTDR
ncbi:MAG TPA: glycosyltransferase [Thermoanaerobaculia bacterium]|jgi:riboflavin transporter FmnP